MKKRVAVQVWASVALALSLLATPGHAVFDPKSFSSLGTLAPGGSVTMTIDTGATPPTITLSAGGGPYTGTVSTWPGQSTNIAVFCFDSINLASTMGNITVTGSRPLALLSRSDMIIAKSLTMAGADGANPAGAAARFGGAAGGDGCRTAGSVQALSGSGSGGGQVPSPTNSGGGAGGGFGGNGGNGGNNTTGGGATYGTANVTDLIGGSGGAGGELQTISGNGGGGGGGGGASELAACGNITINNANAIRVYGGAGASQATAGKPNGGGGSGGLIVVNGHKITLDNANRLNAKGGNGGSNATSAYGGGGGGGGRVVIIYSGALIVSAGTLDAATCCTGGTGGTGAIANGANGSNGTVYLQPMGPRFVDAATGDDTNTGLDWEHPWKTISKAITTGGNPAYPDTYVKAGTYNIGTTNLTLPANNLRFWGSYDASLTGTTTDTRTAGLDDTIINPDVTGTNTSRFLNGNTRTGIVFDGFNFSGYLVQLTGNGGGAVFNVTTGPYDFTFRNCVFEGNRVNGSDTLDATGGALYFSAITTNGNLLTLEGCRFVNNDVHPYTTNTDNRGGAVCITNGGGAGTNYRWTLRVADCEFTSNTAYAGGAISGWGWGDPQLDIGITRSKFIKNAGRGGGIYMGRSNLLNTPTASITNCFFSQNGSLDPVLGLNGAALQIGTWANGPATVANCTFDGNFGDPTTSAGCTLCVNGATTTATLINNVFTNNAGYDVVRINAGGINSNYSYYYNNTFFENEINEEVADQYIQYVNVGGNDRNGTTPTTDPQYLDRLNGDLRTADTSPLIDAGMDSGLTDDIDGTGRRPVDNINVPNSPTAYDLGAYENQAVPVTISRFAIE